MELDDIEYGSHDVEYWIHMYIDWIFKIGCIRTSDFDDDRSINIRNL